MTTTIDAANEAFAYGYTIAWSPASISGLVAWFDASDATTLFTDAGSTPVASDGDAVWQWNDKRGSGPNLDQATSGARPAYKTAIQNGKSVVRFGGDDLIFKATTPSTSQPLTAFLVAKHGTNQVGLSTDAGSTWVSFVDASNHFGLYAGGTSLVGSVARNGAWHQFSIVADGNSSVLYCDGASEASGGSPGTDGMVGLRLGASAAGGSNLVGDIGEVLVYTGALSTGDRQSVESFLKTRWGTP